MYQNGDIELWFKTDKKTLKRIKDALLLKKSVEINKLLHQNNYHLLLHTEPGKNLLLCHYENKDVKFNLDKKIYVNISDEKELMDDAMDILAHLAGSGYIKILGMSITEAEPFILYKKK